ncbi:MAG: hypothetical protein GX638_00130 [Crenarchaeota archaeon]|nr:hypothetical protein [Thermoproteota archaeon]
MKSPPKITKEKAIKLIHKIRNTKSIREFQTDVFTEMIYKNFDETSLDLGYRQGFIKALHMVFDIQEDEYK